MKWPRWLPRLLTEPVNGLEPQRRPARIPTPPERVGIRDVGNCEVCGRQMKARTRREEFRGRVDCDCGHRNHVEFREVRSASGDIAARHVTVTTGRRFESATHTPDLRLAWRFGVCPSCSMAECLIDAYVLSHEDAGGTVETIAYYCTNCRVDDDVRRGRLMGHDGIQIIDSLQYQQAHDLRREVV